MRKFKKSLFWERMTMRNLLISELLIASGLMFIIGCNEPQQHQVAIAPPTIPDNQSDGQQPMLDEIRPLDTGESEVSEPQRGEDPPTISEATTASEYGSSNMYKVKRGDTLWRIAKTQLGDGQRYREILKLNPNVEARKLRVGQPIRLPEK